MRIAIFEDAEASDFAPVALTRPVFELLCGHFSLRERLIRFLDVHDWGAFVRPHLAETYREEQAEAWVNDFAWLAHQPTLLINGRWLASAEGIEQLKEADFETVGVCGDSIAFILLDADESSLLCDRDFDDPLLKIAAGRNEVRAYGHLVERPWHLIDLNAHQIEQDFHLRKVAGGKADLGQIAVLGSPENVYIDPAADVDPFVVIDARAGSVFVDAGVQLQAFTRLEGPVFIGADTQTFRANIKAGSSIGEVCRVGGEIEASIMHGYVNKYHDGFLGHAYVCPWVNLGALTTNSDLKNDYSNVRVPLAGEPIDSRSRKVGCFIGDHSKTALCSLFNTGSSIGVMTMVLPGGELLPKHIPSFSRVWHGQIDDELDIDGSIATARVAMERRNVELTSAQERLLLYLNKQTQQERTDAVNRFRAKEVGLSIVRP